MVQRASRLRLASIGRDAARLPDRLGIYVLDVAPDAPDLRDQIYRPSLRPLGRCLFRKTDLHRLRVRDQSNEGTCAGQALASMIDYLRVTDTAKGRPRAEVSPASARMLIHFARLLEQHGSVGHSPPASGVNSLRSAIKAFYHNGVCLDEHWPYVAGDQCSDLTIKRSNEARKLGLGAYFRLEPVLNDYHAALSEAGAIYVAAHTHDNWDSRAVKAAHGRIEPGTRSMGGHAFVIVGYDDTGFLVLNSWGKDWGGFEGVPGIAHWSYHDWSESVMDGWVLRLAVSTPKAFDISAGLQGLSAGMNLPIASASTPRIELLGHYVHLDDGRHVQGGRYPSSPKMLDETVKLLQEKSRAGKYQHVLLWLAGANEATKDAVADAARLKRIWMAAGIYPITVFWCSDFVEEIVGMLDSVFAKAKLRVGRTGPALDQTIKIEVRGAGRAFLRDIKRRSQVSARPDGKMVEVLQQLAPLAPHCRLHLVAEGVGAIMAADLAACSGAAGAAGLQVFETVTLLSPTLTTVRFHELLGSLPPGGRPKVAVITPNPATEQRMRVGEYSQSIIHLVDHAFEEGPETGVLVGLSAVARKLKKKLAGVNGHVLFQEVAADADVDQPKLHHVTRAEAVVKLIGQQIGAEISLSKGQYGARPRYAPAL